MSKTALKIIGVGAIGLLVGIVIGIGVGAACKCREGESQEDSEPEEGESDSDSDNSDGAVAAPETEPVPKRPPTEKGDRFPLQLGSSGPRVERLQVFIMRNYGGVGKLSGVFDSETLEKVRSYLKTETVSEATYDRFQMGQMVHDQHRKN